MSWITVSRAQRLQAQEIIIKLRETMTREAIAEQLGISPSYVSFAASCQPRPDGGYLCPVWAINKILSYEDSFELLTRTMEESAA